MKKRINLEALRDHIAWGLVTTDETDGLIDLAIAAVRFCSKRGSSRVEELLVLEDLASRYEEGKRRE